MRALAIPARPSAAPPRIPADTVGPLNRLSCVSRDRGNETSKVGARDAEALPGVRGVPRCGGSALLERRDNIGRGGRIQQRRVMPIPPAAGVGVGGRIRRGLRNGHNVRGPHVAGIGHAGQPDGCTGDDAGGDDRQGDVAGDATGDGGVNFVLL